MENKENNMALWHIYNFTELLQNSEINIQFYLFKIYLAYKS